MKCCVHVQRPASQEIGVGNRGQIQINSAAVAGIGCKNLWLNSRMGDDDVWFFVDWDGLTDAQVDLASLVPNVVNKFPGFD